MSEGEPTEWSFLGSAINCDKDASVCVEARSSLMDNGVLWPELTTYEVEQWNRYEIITKPDDRLCERFRIRIDLVNKTVTGISTRIRKAGVWEALEPPEVLLHLSDGLKATLAYQEKQNKIKRQIMQVPKWLLEDSGSKEKAP